MAIFTAVAAAVSAAVGGGIFGAVAGFAARTLLTVGITKLISNRAGKTAAGTQDAGSRVQLPPASNNKLPVVYGTAYMAPIITDAKISDDQKTMWYVCALAEVTDTGGYTFGDIYWGGKKVIFDGTDTSKVIELRTNSYPVQVDDKVNGKIHIYKFPNGSASGISTGGSNAITLLSDASIPSDQRWNGPIYTTGGQSAAMTNTAFIVVKVEYNRDANTTRLETMSVELTNSLTKPGSVLNDYMTNTRYGCAISPSDIDSASITVLNNYSDELITYIPVGGGSATTARYRINGPVNTGQNCLNNLQELIDACDSWLQYSELTGQWTIVVNKPYDWDGTTLGDLYQVTDDVLISGINVNPIDLNSAYNVLEVQFPDTEVNDQTNYNVINLIDFAPEVMSYNEPENILTVQFPQVNTYLQSTYLGVRRLLQSREDLTIDFLLDYSGIQVVAGDVICVPFDKYGWEAFNSGYGKLFRVSQVQEAKLDDGTLGARITAFEYNSTVYADDPIQDYVAESNTGLSDPNIFDKPGTPTVATNPLTDGNVKSFKITSTVPSNGSVMYMDYNFGTSSNVATHRLLRTVQTADGNPFVSSASTNIDVTTLPPATYYFSTTARTISAGRTSNSSASYVWNGPNVTEWDSSANTGGITNNNIANSTITGSKVSSNTITSNNLTTTGVTSGVYTNTNLTVDSAGRITLATNGTAGIAGIAVQEEGTNVVASANTINFVGSAVTVSNVSNVATVTITSGGSSNVWTREASDAYGPYSGTAAPFGNAFSHAFRNESLRIPGGKEFYWDTGSGGIAVQNYTQTSSDWNPWMQATATTANGFLAASTSAFQPANAKFQSGSVINPSTGQIAIDGAHGWITIGGSQVSAGSNANSQYNYTGTFNVVSDADCTIQLGGATIYAIGSSVTLSPAYVDMSTVNTINLVANRPQLITSEFHTQGNIINSTWITYYMSTVLKNPTSGANVFVTQGSWLILDPIGWTWPY